MCAPLSWRQRRTTMTAKPDRATLAGQPISRLISGLWRVADIERGGTPLDLDRGADALAAYAEAGFDSFDMADHYGSAELIAGRLISRFRGRPERPKAFTKWCP